MGHLPESIIYSYTIHTKDFFPLLSLSLLDLPHLMTRSPDIFRHFSYFNPWYPLIKYPIMACCFVYHVPSKDG